MWKETALLFFFLGRAAGHIGYRGTQWSAEDKKEEAGKTECPVGQKNTAIRLRTAVRQRDRLELSGRLLPVPTLFESNPPFYGGIRQGMQISPAKFLYVCSIEQNQMFL